MFPVKSVSDKLLFSTIRIEAIYDERPGSGTGFFYEIVLEGKGVIPVIVTNKHVVEGAKDFRFNVCLADESGDAPSGKHVKMEADIDKEAWNMHPDPAVDLCILSVAPIIEEARKRGEKLYIQYIGSDLVKTDEELSQLRAVEEVLMVGYPMGLWDSKHNLPIVRQGITATHPSIDFEGRPEGLVDMACWPGSSGSPVLIVNEGGYTTKDGGRYRGATRVILLGVLKSGPVLTETGEIVIRPIPMQSEEKPVAGTLINLGFIVKAKALHPLEELARSTAEMGESY